MPQEMRFYHLDSSPLERALPQLLKAAHQKGHRVLIKVKDETEAERLNDLLWSFSDTSFLPHGSKKDGHAEHQPIFLTSTDENPNNADMLVLTQGQEVADISSFALCCDMFDGTNDAHLKAARQRWKKHKDTQELDLSYYQQDSKGIWQKKA